MRNKDFPDINLRGDVADQIIEQGTDHKSYAPTPAGAAPRDEARPNPGFHRAVIASLIHFAYEHGYHEHGYDVLATYDAALAATPFGGGATEAAPRADPPSDEAIRAYLAAYDNDLHKAGPKGVNAAEQYDFLRRWLGAAYAVDFPAAARAPGREPDGK